MPNAIVMLTQCIKGHCFSTAGYMCGSNMCTYRFGSRLSSMSLPSATGIPSSTTKEIIGAYAGSTRPVVLFVVEAAIFLGVMLPILVSLLYFSNAHSRRSLMWNAVMLDVILCIGLGVWTVQAMVRRFHWPFIPHLIYPDLLHVEPVSANSGSGWSTRLRIL
jgi:hypothetical protein